VAVPISTRDKLIGAALELFATQGYAGTSVTDILNKAGVNAGSLYYLFPGKRDLLLAVLDAYHEGIYPMLLEPAWQGVDDPIERIFALLRRYRQALQMTDCSYGCPIGSLALEIHEPDPQVRQRLADNFARWVDAIEQCLIDAGPRIPADIDRRALATMALTTMEGGVMLARTERRIDPFDRAVAMLRVMFEHLGALPSPRNRRRRARRP
jgi:AcrR family transcriptional regulator